MKKRLILAAMAAMMTMTVAIAQQIAVVSEGGETTLYQTFQVAIEGADPGSVIYLPGGSFPIADDVIITKRLTIIGVGHKILANNTEGNTFISGNLHFGEGSSGSAVLACYITGGLDIGSGNSIVNDVLIRYCNLRGMNVSSQCTGTTINQNYLRWEFGSDYARITLNGSNCNFTNNVCGPPIENLNGGLISNNIIINTWYNNSIYECSNVVITNNIIFGGHSGANQLVSGNMTPYEWGENCIIVEGVGWNNIFVNYTGGAVGTMWDLHFKEGYQQYSNCGIYGGTGFNDNQMAPVPYIVAKRIAEETDAAGQLKIQVRVKSGE